MHKGDRVNSTTNSKNSRLRGRTDRACLVAFYDIRPGNGVGLFLQPRNPHGATSVHCTATALVISSVLLQSRIFHILSLYLHPSLSSAARLSTTQPLSFAKSCSIWILLLSLVGLPLILPSVISWKSLSCLKTWPIHRCFLSQIEFIVCLSSFILLQTSLFVTLSSQLISSILLHIHSVGMCRVCFSMTETGEDVVRHIGIVTLNAPSVLREFDFVENQNKLDTSSSTASSVRLRLPRSIHIWIKIKLNYSDFCSAIRS